MLVKALASWALCQKEMADHAPALTLMDLLPVWVGEALLKSRVAQLQSCQPF